MLRDAKKFKFKEAITNVGHLRRIKKNLCSC